MSALRGCINGATGGGWRHTRPATAGTHSTGGTRPVATAATDGDDNSHFCHRQRNACTGSYSGGRRSECSNAAATGAAAAAVTGAAAAGPSRNRGDGGTNASTDGSDNVIVQAILAPWQWLELGFWKLGKPW